MQIYRFGELVELDQPLTPDDVQAVVDEAHRRKAALQALPLERSSTCWSASRRPGPIPITRCARRPWPTCPAASISARR